MKNTSLPAGTIIGYVLFSGAVGFAAALVWHLIFYLQYPGMGIIEFLIQPAILYIIPCALAYVITMQMLKLLGLAKASSIIDLGIVPLAIGAAGVHFMAYFHIESNRLFVTYTGEQWWQALILAVVFAVGLVSALYMTHARLPQKVRRASITWKLVVVITTLLAIIATTSEYIA